jgi:hypothetical protein
MDIKVIVMERMKPISYSQYFPDTIMYSTWNTSGTFAI